MKTYAGGDIISDTSRTLAFATTLQVPDNTNLFYLTGTATCTALNANGATRNRLVTFACTSGSQTFTNTTGTSTAGKMDLGGSNVTLNAGDILNLFLKSNGVWVLFSMRRNSVASGSLTIASATPTIPDTADIFSVSGTSSITTWTVTTPGRPRRILLYGAASAAVPFVNTDSPSAGQMNLRGSNRILFEDYVMELLVKTDGTMTLIGISA